MHSFSHQHTQAQTCVCPDSLSRITLLDTRQDINYRILSPILSRLWGSCVATANSFLDFQTLWSPQLLWSGPLLQNLTCINLSKWQARLLSCGLVPVWDRLIYMARVCFRGVLTGKGAGYVACCNPHGITLLAERRVFCQLAVCGCGCIRAQDFWFWQKQHISHFIAGYSCLCNQYRTFLQVLFCCFMWCLHTHIAMHTSYQSLYFYYESFKGHLSNVLNWAN